MIPGEYILKDGDILCNTGKDAITIKVVNTGDRPVQIGSHFHFFEVNRQMSFNRESAYGKRLNIPAGTAVRFEPGEEKEVELVPFGGKQFIAGFSNLVNNSVSDSSKEKALKNIDLLHFKNTKQ